MLGHTGRLMPAAIAFDCSPSSRGGLGGPADVLKQRAGLRNRDFAYGPIMLNADMVNARISCFFRRPISAKFSPFLLRFLVSKTPLNIPASFDVNRPRGAETSVHGRNLALHNRDWRGAMAINGFIKRLCATLLKIEKAARSRLNATQIRNRSDKWCARDSCSPSEIPAGAVRYAYRFQIGAEIPCGTKNGRNSWRLVLHGSAKRGRGRPQDKQPRAFFRPRESHYHKLCSHCRGYPISHLMRGKPGSRGGALLR